MRPSKSCSGSSDGMLLRKVRVQRLDWKWSVSMHRRGRLGATQASASIAGCACKHRNVGIRLIASVRVVRQSSNVAKL